MKQVNRRGQPALMPNCISKYNAGMLGVDLSDWKTQKYRINIMSKKWYFNLITHCLDVAVVNGHIIYNLVKEKDDQVDLLQFRTMVTTTLLRHDSDSKPQRTGTKIVHLPREIALAGGTNTLERTEGGKQRKCRNCKRNARKQCVGCNAGFRMDCFSAFHY